MAPAADAPPTDAIPVDAPTLTVSGFLNTRPPYADLPISTRAAVVAEARELTVAPGDVVYAVGDRLEGLYGVLEGQVEVRDANDAVVSLLGPGNSFAERGLMRDGAAATRATVARAGRLLIVPAETFLRLRRAYPAFERFFTRAPAAVAARPSDLAATPIAELMTADPITCRPEDTIQQAARVMRDRRVSCLLATDADGALRGILTARDLGNRAVADGVPPETPVAAIMTADPITLTPDALGGDVLFEMLERRIGHLPVVADGRLVGVVTQTDLTRRQALSAASLLREIHRAESAAGIAQLTARIPALLAQLVGAGHRHDVVTRMVTDIADAATRRIIRLAEAALGPAPARYLWLACGSQGRREQTGVSDQDNCLFIEDGASDADMAYFADFADRVTAGLAECGYVLCPGEMMASNPRWRQPTRVWREYFEGWIARPDPMAQMLASVMFDLRPIAGDEALFDPVIGDVLERASENSIFVAHMVRNAVGHAPPLGLFGGVVAIRSGEHKQTIDMKHNGVAPVADLGRIYALLGALRPVNTRARIQAAFDARVVSPSGGRDLLDAYDLIAETRLQHQARLVKDGAPIDNFMPPGRLSDLERSHLRDAFVVVRTMQSALGQGRASVM